MINFQRLCPPTWDGASCIPPTQAGTKYQHCQLGDILKFRINILILYVNIVYVTFIEGGTAVFPCMASAFGISYSPDCKQSLGSLHWTYATKKLYVH